jgi:hypothetical protein
MFFEGSRTDVQCVNPEKMIDVLGNIKPLLGIGHPVMASEGSNQCWPYGSGTVSFRSGSRATLEIGQAIISNLEMTQATVDRLWKLGNLLWPLFSPEVMAVDSMGDDMWFDVNKVQISRVFWRSRFGTAYVSHWGHDYLAGIPEATVSRLADGAVDVTFDCSFFEWINPASKSGLVAEKYFRTRDRKIKRYRPISVPFPDEVVRMNVASFDVVPVVRPEYVKSADLDGKGEE